MPNLINKIGLVSNDGKYFGFAQIAEEVSCHVVDKNGNVVSNDVTSSAGKYMFVYNDETLNAYSEEIVFTVNAFYNGYKDRRVYAMGEIVISPSIPTVSDTLSHEIEFIGWDYNGKIYLVDDNNQLYTLVNEEKVYLRCVSSMTITPKYKQTLKQFTITLVNNGVETTLEETYGYGEKISSSDVGAPEGTGSFMGWHIDSELKIAASNYPVKSDMTLYAKWYTKDVFLVGTIEGYEAWGDQRKEYKFTNNGYNVTNHYVLENVYLQAGDVVKPREFKLTGNEDDDWWFSDWTGIPNNSVSELVTDENGSINLRINQSGYYSFYIHQYKTDSNGNGVQEIHVTFQQYIVYFEFDEADLVGINMPDYRFSLPWNSHESFPLVGVADKDKTGINPTTPQLEKNIDGVKYVLKGWYTKPVDGEKVTELTPDMLSERNAITLYPEFVEQGYHLIEGAKETYIGPSQAADLYNLPEYKTGESITIHYYNGAVNTATGSYELDLSAIDYTNSTVEISVNKITFTQDGLYDIYQDETGKLHIVQYHKVSYIFSTRYVGVDLPLTPTINGDAIKSKVEYIQSYGSDVAVVETKEVITNNNLSVTFIGWMPQGDYGTPTAATKVTGNQVYEAVYKMQSNN